MSQGPKIASVNLVSDKDEPIVVEKSSDENIKLGVEETTVEDNNSSPSTAPAKLDESPARIPHEHDTSDVKEKL